MSFFEHTNLKIKVNRVWGYIESTPLYDSSVCMKESYPSNISTYELILMGPCNRTLYYNGVSTHITKPSIIFLPHPATDIVSPPIKEYRTHTFLTYGYIGIQFTCDQLISSAMEVYSCDKYLNVLIPLFNKMRNTFTNKSSGYEHMCLSLLYHIFATIQTHNSSSYLSETQYNLIKASLDYIDSDFLNPDFNYNNLAIISGISVSYYDRIFKKKFGISPKQFVLTKKLKYAADLLCISNHSVTQIAEFAGFSNVYHFSKIFKKYYSLSPQKFRNLEVHQD